MFIDMYLVPIQSSHGLLSFLASNDFGDLNERLYGGLCIQEMNSAEAIFSDFVVSRCFISMVVAV